MSIVLGAMPQPNQRVAIIRGVRTPFAKSGTLYARLTALDQDYAEGLASCERDTVVVSHDAVVNTGAMREAIEEAGYEIEG